MNKFDVQIYDNELRGIRNSIWRDYEIALEDPKPGDVFRLNGGDYHILKICGPNMKDWSDFLHANDLLIVEEFHTNDNDDSDD